MPLAWVPGAASQLQEACVSPGRLGRAGAAAGETTGMGGGAALQGALSDAPSARQPRVGWKLQPGTCSNTR